MQKRFGAKAAVVAAFVAASSLISVGTARADTTPADATDEIAVVDVDPGTAPKPAASESETEPTTEPSAAAEEADTSMVTAATDVAPTASTITKTVESKTPPAPAPGGTITYKMVFTYDGTSCDQGGTDKCTVVEAPNAAPGAPGALTLDSFTCDPAFAFVGGVCEASALAAGTYTFGATVTIAGSVGQLACNFIKVLNGDGSAGPSTGSCFTISDVMAISKTFLNNPAVAGTDTNVFEVVVTNTGGAALTNVKIEDSLPLPLDIVQVIDQNGNPCPTIGAAFTCSFASVAPGDTVRAIVQYRVPSDATVQTLTNTALVTTDQTVARETNDAGLTIIKQLSLRLTKSFGVGRSFTDSFSPGEAGFFELEIFNGGPSDATGVTLFDAIPAALTRLAVAGVGVPCTITGQQLNCNIGTISGRSTIRISVLFEVSTLTPPGVTVDNEAELNSVETDRITATASLLVTGGPGQTGGTINGAGSSPDNPIPAGNTGTVTYPAGTFGPNQPITVQQFSPPPGTIVGTGTSNADGSATITFTIPRDTVPGVHQLVASDPLGNSITTTIYVSPATAIAGTELALTGTGYSSGPAAALIGLLVLLTGVTLIAVRRRNSTAVRYRLGRAFYS